MPHNEPMRCSIAKLRLGVGSVLLLAGSWVIVSGPGAQTVSVAETVQNNQMAGIQPSGSVPDKLPSRYGSDPTDPMERQQRERMAQAQKVARQRKLEQDTDKLLALAKQLREEVDKSNADTLSTDVVKTAAEIQKLAKSVQSKLRY